MIIAKEHAEFLTITCLEWTHILKEDRFKDIVIDSLRFLSKEERIQVFGFVIMSNHFHLIWQMLGDHKLDDVQRDFLKFTSHEEHQQGQGVLISNRLKTSYYLVMVIILQ